MKKVLIYDLPLRVFHWFFSIGFFLTFMIGKFVEDESKIYSIHMILGIFMTLLVIMRILWGIVGTHYSRFANFVLRPRELFHYLKHIFGNTTQRYQGHNPGSSYAGLVMFLMVIGLSITGFIMTNLNGSNFFEEVHEILSSFFLLIVIFHIAGLLLHEFRHNDEMILAMISGEKELLNEPEVNIRPRVKTGITFIVISFILLTTLFSIYDYNAQKLELNGISLKLYKISELDSD